MFLEDPFFKSILPNTEKYHSFFFKEYVGEVRAIYAVDLSEVDVVLYLFILNSYQIGELTAATPQINLKVLFR